MDAIAFVGICFLCVFLFRDAQLLNARQASSFGSPLYIYGLVILVSILAASGLHATSPVQIMQNLRAPWIWGLSVGLHLAGLGFCIWLRRRRLLKWSWLVAVFPSPMLALLLLGIIAEFPTTGASGVGIAVVVATGWTLMVGGAGVIIKRIGGSDSEFAVDFAALSNSTALALLPLAPFF